MRKEYESDSALSVKRLASKYGVHPCTMARRLRRAGATIRHEAPRKAGPLPVREMADLYEYGFSLAAISTFYEAARKTVRARLEEAGMTIRPGGGPLQLYRPSGKQLSEEHEAGASLRQLQEKYGMPKPTIYSRIKRLREGAHES